jgi:hypothetical protein
VGAEVIVDGVFKKPDGVVGPYFIVTVAAAEFAYGTTDPVRGLVAADLSASGIRVLPDYIFCGCAQLAGVAFPRELASIGDEGFVGCGALHIVDLTATQLGSLGDGAFAKCGVTRVTVPASLREIGSRAFAHTPLKNLDLSACDGIHVWGEPCQSLLDVSLPREGFMDAAKAFLQESMVEVLRANVDETEIDELVPQLGELRANELRIISPLVGGFVWQRSRGSVLVELTDPVAVTAVASVKLTSWRAFPEEWKPLLRVVDLSGLAVGRLPDGATLEGFVWLEKVVLPTGLRVLPDGFFRGCCRLLSIDTSYTALEEIGIWACHGCLSLTSFPFPRTVREVWASFEGTSITSIDLTSTAAEKVAIGG